MSEPTLTEVFGDGTTQDSDSITIPKANLPGLTPLAQNTAESLVAGLNTLWATTLSPNNQTTNRDQQITVTDSGFPGTVQRNGNNYRQITYNINFQKLDTTDGLDPNDY